MSYRSAMFPLICKVCKRNCIWNDVYEICAKTFLEGTFMCAPSFLVCARLKACVHTHSLEGTCGVSAKLWLREDDSENTGSEVRRGSFCSPVSCTDG